MYNHECRTGREVVEQHRRARSDFAAELWVFRRKAQKFKHDFTIQEINGLSRKVFAKQRRWIPFRPTAAKFEQKAREMLAYSKEPIGHYGNEYYSCCGMEDAECYRKEEARNAAIEYFRAARYLRGEDR